MRQSIAQDWAWEAAKTQVQLNEQMISEEYHSVVLYRQEERSSINDGEEVNKLAEG